MREIPQWVDTVFDEKYWGAVQELPEQQERKNIPYIKSRSERHSLCAQAATNIFRGGSGELFTGDAFLDYSPENKFIQPGNVLLLDTELVMPCNKSDAIKQSQDKQSPIKSPYMESPAELVATPAALFRKNSMMGRLPFVGETCRIAFLYDKKLHHPPSEQTYRRRVELVFVGYDKDGEIAEPERQRFWHTNYRSDLVAGDCRARDIFVARRFSLPATVGETYAHPRREDTLYRVKSVELCLQGTLKYAEAKKRSFHLPRFAGRIATAPHMT